MPQKSRTNSSQTQWSIQGAKDKKEQERVRQMLAPIEQNEKKKVGRPKKEIKEKKSE